MKISKINFGLIRTGNFAISFGALKNCKLMR